MNEEVVQVAVPEVMVWAEQPVMVVPPDLKLTVPVGVTPPPETVAVSVVEAPTVMGFGLAVTAVDEGPAETTMEKLELVDPV